MAIFSTVFTSSLLLKHLNTTSVAFSATAKIDIHCLKTDFWKVVLPHVFFFPMMGFFGFLQMIDDSSLLQHLCKCSLKSDSLEIKTEKEHFTIHKNAFPVSLYRRRVLQPEDAVSHLCHLLCVFISQIVPNLQFLLGQKHPFKSVRNKALIKNAESAPLPPY